MYSTAVRFSTVIGANRSETKLSAIFQILTRFDAIMPAWKG